MFISGLADDSLQWQYPNIYFAFNQQLRHEFKNVLSKCTKKMENCNFLHLHSQRFEFEQILKTSVIVHVVLL